MDSWKNVYRERHQKDAIVRKLLEEMVEDSRNRMRHIDGIASIGMVHARDVLENIIAGQNGEERDLTRIFYARKTLKRLRRGWVLDQWRAYRSSQQDFPVWQGCALMAMFSDHEMELSDIDRQFQDLADEFLAQSPVPSHDHSLSVPSPTVALPNSFDRYSPGSFSTHDFGLSPAPLGGARQNLVSSEHRQDKLRREMVVEQYSRHYNAQAERLKHLIQFFTGDKGFKGNTDNYYDPFNSFIDKVLSRKVGIPISLCIVFSELAHRVGITGVDLMGFPQHFMIRFRPAAPMTMEHTSSPLPEAEDFVATPPAPPTYYLDLFHPPHRLLSTEEYENYFSSLNIPQPANVYRDLPTPPLEIFLRCLRNIILAFEQRGGAGRWGIYLLWLKYLSNFWPEDVGFIRTSIEDMELIDHRRSAIRSHFSPLQNQQSQQRQHHVFGYRQGTLHSSATPAPHLASSTYETIKILRSQVRELEMADEIGDVGQIRRRRRPKVTSAAPAPPVSPPPALEMQGSRPIGHSEGRDISMQISASSPTASSPTIDSQSSHAHNQLEQQNSISGEQQSGAQEQEGSSADLEGDDRESRQPRRLSPTFGGGERRRPEPEYYVGEVFRHLIYRYTGAIYGYDLKCEADENWILSMGIDSLVHGRNQPFYNALLGDGSRRYVAQENIQVLFRDYRSRATSTHGAGRHTPTNSSLATVAASESPPILTPTPPTTLTPVATTAEATTQAPDEPAETTAGMAASFYLQFSELGPLGIETVGQYFEAWDGKHGHYVMNKELRKVYPTEDYQ
ncbi:hypothetical protein BGZ58_010585 [Dissophora ornata]|nr:hypothetical protein BGZ58_010585 [Dissophora ornata]